MDEVSDWVRSNRFQLNTAKTEILWCSTTRRQNHLPSAAVRVRVNHVLPSTTVRDLTWEFSSTATSLCGLMCRVRCRDVLLCYDNSAASDVQCPILCSIRWLYRWLCHVSTTAMQHSPSTSVGAQRRRQTDTPTCLVWARHTDAARPSLAAVSGTHRFQLGCAHLPMPAWSGVTVSLRLHPACRRFQPPPSPVVVILTAGDPTNTAVHCWRSCVSGGWKPPLEQSAARRHLSSNADCFPEPPQNLSLFPIISFLTIFGF